MSNKVNGLWAVNSSSVFMFFDSVNTPSVWRFEMKDGVESWRMIPGVKNAQAVRGVAAAYRADGGTWLDPNGPDYAQAVSEIGDVPLIVERGDGEPAGTGRCRLSFASHADVVEKTGGTH